jgi:hypothetical protein
MACGCKKGNNSVSRGPAIRPGVYNRSSNANSGNIIPAAQVRAQAVPPTPASPPVEVLVSSKRKVQAARRDAILKAKGK